MTYIPISNTRPNFRQVHQKWKLTENKRGHPYYLPTIRDVQRTNEGKYVQGTTPNQCAGPAAKQYPKDAKRRYPCNKYEFCVFCWERRSREAGALTCGRYIDVPTMVKYSQTFPAIRSDADLLSEARGAVKDALRDANFTHYSIWSHVFGEDPREGPKGHLDGWIGGEDPDLSILEGRKAGSLAKELDAYYWQGSKHYTPMVHTREAPKPTTMARARDLVLGGFYAGRITFPTRRIWAGLYGPPSQVFARMTNIDRSKKPSQVGPLRIGPADAPRIVDDYTKDDIIEAQRIHLDWRDRIGRPMVSRQNQPPTPKGRNLWEQATHWRHRYRLNDSEMARRLKWKARG